jgi:hypothetical protein
LGLWFLFLDEKLQKDNTFFTAIQDFKQKGHTLNRDCWWPYKSLQNPLGWVQCLKIGAEQKKFGGSRPINFQKNQ